MLIFTGIMFYSIIRYKLWDISTVIHKTLMWLTTSGLALLPVLFTILSARPWITNLTDLQLSGLVALYFLLLVFYIKTIQPRIDHLFQRRKYDMQKILQGMVKELVLLKDLEGLINKIVATIREALYVSNSSIILWEKKRARYSMRGLDLDIDLSSHHTFMDWLRREDRVVEWNEIEADPRFTEIKSSARQYFEALSVKVALPLIHDKNLIGIINLGEKDNLKPFTRSDIEFLSNLRVEASIALSNSLLYDDVQKMSEAIRQWALDLEKKVEERTRELSESKEELERSYKKLQELDQVKTQFFANISHELRTPLTLILAPLESILHRDSVQGERREDLSAMYQNGLRLLKLINNLLDLAKIDAGKMQLSHLKTDFTKFTKGIIASVTPLAEKKGISLSFTGPNPLNEFYFDRDKIEKVLLNLIFNALKFTNPGGKVDVSCEQREDQILVRISDTGIGIAKENIDKLFNRFSQIDASSNRRFEGTGIGLALSKELIELHKGEIWAESELGKGTVISFTLPYLTDPICIPEHGKEGEADWTRSLHKAAEYTTAGIVQEGQSIQTAPSNGAPAGAPKILVVEDNPDMLHFLVTQLQDDYQVVTAQNGVDGVQCAQTDLPNLILSDVMMPIKDGYQLCREVKENALTKHIPIVLISAKADLSMKIEGLEYGADDYLTKPFSCEELRARIKSLLNQRGLETQLIHSEKMAALGLLVAGMAHEINNPISFAKVSLENLHNTLAEQDRLLKEGAAPDSAEMKRLNAKIDRAFSIIKTGLDRTEAIVSDLKAFVRKDEAQFRPTDLHEGLDSTLNLMRTELKDRITIVKEYGEIDPVDAVPGQLNQVFMNLLQNAIHAIPDEGEIRIKTWKEDDRVKISVKDSGTGISPEHQKRIFEPFFTTKEAGKGTGLGLSVSYRILQSHRGDITVISRPGQGTEFVITLPVRQTISTAHQNTLGARGKETS
ncbi:response regulator [Nitrospiraceae bacterium HYJII51-Mn-bac16s-1-B09]|uniref:histidine kinase n=2 Tax=Candidatus Manganitrophus noduliformans TaxID=2606439 RepID=A0A7X6DPV5_9BACT|nr:response regulator [Candidatus Manganitrophus noduliformans]